MEYALLTKRTAVNNHIVWDSSWNPEEIYNNYCIIYMLSSECKDSSSNKHGVGDTWEESCNKCICDASGIPACKPKTCDLDAGDLPPLCEAVYGEGDKCCPGPSCLLWRWDYMDSVNGMVWKTKGYIDIYCSVVQLYQKNFHNN